LEPALRLAFLVQHLRPVMQVRQATGLSAVPEVVVAVLLCRHLRTARQAARAALVVVVVVVVAVAAIRALAARAASVVMATAL
jgi:hypothetical protein